ncbi:hypothetical protein SEA_MINDFLAYER_83 [Streptomyces phage MindFlayer]|uniref:Uncharacterized protein n=1 Tax=Streptomyces phage Bordeaux TaxID=2653769 RepID=A0A5Q2WKP4_9CAUD|nr:hypothetical protein SEA_BIRCHLYN_83 [Streptomyces phage Birchlyn]QGH78971.1 hypothetical protein SEA_TOMSAWYER_84 [Streptomyces phage TomSawyer]QGH79855.1 hypothetical protein SEA_BORDEAUX_84 [Streptomyces phage Bordeaux]QPL13723.1 hypothetical protein SEA_MINDFLAYER_83 [Streptomyces phage MindFlayer]
MHNPFEENPAQERPIQPGILIDGSFSCMTCGEVVDEAEYLPVDKILGWLCSEGHKSLIENFNLGA